jgi:LacI family transcriptional regulator
MVRATYAKKRAKSWKQQSLPSITRRILRLVLSPQPNQCALAVAIASATPRPGLLSVRIDDHAAALAMTRHILSLGHARIGFITGNLDQSASVVRLDGYKAALAEANIPIDPTLIQQGLFTYRSGLKAAEQLLGLAKPPTAIFASNDDMGAATVAVAHRRHLEVPKNLTVCGFDDTELSRSIWPSPICRAWRCCYC